MLKPVIAIQGRDDDFSPDATGVYKRIVPDVNAYVGKGFAGRIEEDKVTRLTGALINLAQVISHLSGCARQAHTVPGKDVLNETAAIEAFTWGFLAPSVRCSPQAQGIVNYGTTP